MARTINHLDRIDPTKTTPVGYSVAIHTKNKTTTLPITFRSTERAEDFALTIKKARPTAETSVMPVYSKRVLDRRSNVAKLAELIKHVGGRRYRCPSRTEPGTYHTVWPDPHGGLHCNCTAGTTGKVCDHLLAALMVEERGAEAA